MSVGSVETVCEGLFFVVSFLTSLSGGLALDEDAVEEDGLAGSAFGLGFGFVFGFGSGGGGGAGSDFGAGAGSGWGGE